MDNLAILRATAESAEALNLQKPDKAKAYAKRDLEEDKCGKKLLVMAQQGLSIQLDEASWQEMQQSQVLVDKEFVEAVGEEMDSAALDHQDDTATEAIFDRFQEEMEQPPPSSSPPAVAIVHGLLEPPLDSTGRIALPVAVAHPLQPRPPLCETTHLHQLVTSLALQLPPVTSASPAQSLSAAPLVALSTTHQREASSASGVKTHSASSESQWSGTSSMTCTETPLRPRTLIPPPTPTPVRPGPVGSHLSNAPPGMHTHTLGHTLGADNWVRGTHTGS
mmetsp:Transcript_45715/g.93530  ORF Transcript_45715/g.93530 Transcript_45715/m.93530 type:complete len:278 (+) Transcript_45715:1191-2024(+)